jgi:hypothetical protein
MDVLAVKKSWVSAFHVRRLYEPSDLTDHAEHLLSKVEKTQESKKTKDIPLRGRVSRRQEIVGSGYFSARDTHRTSTCSKLYESRRNASIFLKPPAILIIMGDEHIYTWISCLFFCKTNVTVSSYLTDFESGTILKTRRPYVGKTNRPAGKTDTDRDSQICSILTQQQ